MLFMANVFSVGYDTEGLRAASANCCRRSDSISPGSSVASTTGTPAAR